MARIGEYPSVFRKVLLLGSYNSEKVSEGRLPPSWPPAHRTCPLFNKIAGVSGVPPPPTCAAIIRVVGEKILVVGLYSSETVTGFIGLFPPPTRTIPLGSRTAACHSLGVVIFPTDENWFVAGSYNSALAIGVPLELTPPVIRTVPS